ncbi:hypothetical protein [Flavobacterium sp.]|uniref:hypothetical protein n=1 Tax=Flavobacterium sp. TaxID=239 RepID=UPI003D0B486D
MKKIILLFALASLNFVHGQKKKSNAPVSNMVLAKSASATVAYNKKKDLFLVIQKDSMLLTKNKIDFNPTNVKITEFKVKTNTFYNVSWNAIEKKETPERKEIASIIENQIWNPVGKSLLIGNTQKIVDITEIQFLDRLKTASQTVIKKRTEGYAFTLLNTGEFTLSNKTSVQKYAFNEKTLKYELVKK